MEAYLGCHAAVSDPDSVEAAQAAETSVEEVLGEYDEQQDNAMPQ